MNQTLRYGFFIQARLGSTRFRGKVLSEVWGGKSLIEMVYERTLKAQWATPENTWVLTSDSPGDDPLADYLQQQRIRCYRGSEHDVFSRFCGHLRNLNKAENGEVPEFFFRICADNPLLEPTFMDELGRSVEVAGQAVPDYACHVDYDGTPAPLTHFGLFAELIRTEAFLGVPTEELNGFDREHVTPFLRSDNRFACCYILMPDRLASCPVRMTVDLPEDLAAVQEVLHTAGNDILSWRDIIETVSDNHMLLEGMNLRMVDQEKEEGAMK